MNIDEIIKVYRYINMIEQIINHPMFNVIFNPHLANGDINTVSLIVYGVSISFGLFAIWENGRDYE